MAWIESSILVPKPVEEVFAFLNKRESHLHFIPRMIELKQTSPGDFGRVGATANGLLNYFGLKIPVQYEIIEHEPGNRLAMKGVMGPVQFKDGYILSGAEKGSHIKFWLELNPTGWTKVFSPFAGLIGRVHAWETLRNLKRELNKIEEIASSPLRGSSQ
jgi:Polyketide cyclase / dehydrase and lipid transport